MPPHEKFAQTLYGVNTFQLGAGRLCSRPTSPTPCGGHGSDVPAFRFSGRRSHQRGAHGSGDHGVAIE